MKTLKPGTKKIARLRGRPLQRRNKRFLQENPLCVMCEAEGRVSVAEEVDHIIPLFKGGADEWKNLQGLCLACHATKTVKDMGYHKGGCDVDGYPLSDAHWWQKSGDSHVRKHRSEGSAEVKLFILWQGI